MLANSRRVQMTLDQQQPVLARVLDQSATRFHQPLRQAGSWSLVRFLGIDRE